MTYPVGDAPDGAFVVGSNFGSDQTEAGLRGQLASPVLNSWQQGQGNWHGKFDEYDSQLSNFHDSQLDMKDRIDLLEGVSGYCNVFMSKNWNITAAGALMLFDTQIGPNVVAVPDNYASIRIPGDARGKGLWRSDLQLTFQPTGSTIVAICRLIVRDDDSGQEYSRRSYNAVVTQYGAQAASFSSTFVLPGNANGYSVYCIIVPSGNIKSMGGTVLSAMSVNRWSSGVGVLANEPDVPDGGSL